MRRILIALAVVTVLCGALVGCGGEGDGEMDENAGLVPAAMEFQDGAEKFYHGQMTCPVCDGKPIKEELYADTKGGRLYFDKQECVDEFKNNKQKYIEEYNQKVMSQQMGQ